MAKKLTQYTITTTGNYIKIYIRGILHLQLPNDEPIVIQAWVKNEQSFMIEYRTRSGTKLTHSEYNQSKKWKAILALLDSQLK